MKTDELTFSGYVALIRRRWKLAVAIGAPIFLGFGIYAYTATPIYEAMATIQVERPLVPETMVQTTVAGYAEELLVSVTQRVLSTENVSRMIDRLKLFGDDRGTVPIDDLVLRVRGSTVVAPMTVESSSARGRFTTTYAYTVAFQYDDAAKAAEVANELARLHVTENSAFRSGSATTTSAFLQVEAEKVAKRLTEVQSKIAALQGQVGGVIAAQDPMMAAQRYEQIDRELASVDAGLRAARERKDVYEAEAIQTPRYRAILSDGQAIVRGEDRLFVAQQELVAAQARYSDNHPDIVRLKREIAALTGGGQTDYRLMATQLRANIALAEEQLSTARQTYSDDHPDVLRLQRNLESLQRQLADAESRGSTPVSRPPADNPMYLQLQTRIQTAQIEINELSSRRAELYGRLSKYAYNPELEAKYGPLARERDLLQQEYEELRDKYTQATLSKTVESEDKGQILTVIEPARAPTSPIEPNRVALMLLGLLLGLGAAFGSAIVADMLDLTVRGSRDIESLLHQTPIAMIPFIDSPGDIVQRRRKRIVFSLIGLTVIVVVIVIGG